MKKIIILSLIIFSGHTRAFDLDASCEKEAMNFGNGTGRDEISLECSDHALKKSSDKKLRKSSDSRMTIIANKNMVFVNDPSSKMKGQNVIAGKYTELQEIEAVALDEVNREIVVLEKSGDVLFFSSVITGNVAPRRILRHADIEGATDIVVNPSKNEVILLHPEKKELLFFSRLANMQAPEGKKNLEMKKRIPFKGGDKLKLDLIKQELFVADSKNKTGLTFHLK